MEYIIDTRNTCRHILPIVNFFPGALLPVNGIPILETYIGKQLYTDPELLLIIDPKFKQHYIDWQNVSGINVKFIFKLKPKMKTDIRKRKIRYIDFKGFKSLKEYEKIFTKEKEEYLKCIGFGGY